MMTDDVLAEVLGLVAGYGDNIVLDGIDLTVRRGEILVILGGSGCGKSTLLKQMIGLHRPIAGSVRLLGMEIADADEHELEAALQRVGILFQGGALLNSLTLHENVALPLRERTQLPSSLVDDIVQSKLILLGLGHAGHLYPRELSGGMKKRAGLARAMVADPDILFCDEPSAGLDPITAADLDRVVVGLRDRFNMGIVVVTHELDSIRTIADQVVMLKDRKILAQGPLAVVAKSDDSDVRDFFERRQPPKDAAPRSVLDAFGGTP